MAGGGTQQSLRKYLGALKDTTTVSLAKVNSDYKVGPLLWFLWMLNCIWSFPYLSLYFHRASLTAGLPFLRNQQELDIAIVKATNHSERPSREKYIRGNGISCLLDETLGKTESCILWTVFNFVHSWACVQIQLNICHNKLFQRKALFCLKFIRFRLHTFVLVFVLQTH